MDTQVNQFEPFPKIPRLRRDCTITEKIDGTNAQIFIRELDEDSAGAFVVHEGVPYTLQAGSRNRFLTPENDNYGFARWVYENRDELVKLGPGRHFGEWFGAGIQRRYGLEKKHFALFNVNRWRDNPERPECCLVVPTLYEGPFSDAAIDQALNVLRRVGSLVEVVDRFDNPEGVVVYMHASRSMHKVLLENDHIAKGQVAA